MVFMMIVLGGLSLTPDAQARVKDSYSFMKDDGIFSDEEKDEEAEYVYKSCSNNSFHSIYYDCGCVAGSFRLQRDGELVPRDHILGKIYRNEKSQCANTLGIAGEMYGDCMSNFGNDTNLKRRGIEATKMCSCFANKVAVDFSKTPKMQTSYIKALQVNAYTYCRSIKGRQENDITKGAEEVFSNTEKKERIENTERDDKKSNSLLPSFSEK